MWVTEASIDIAAPAQEVYEYLADLRRHKEWSWGLAGIEQTRGNGIEVGAEFTAQEKVPAKFTSYSRVTRLDAPRAVEWHAWDGKTFQVDWAFDITRNGEATRVVQRARVQPTSFLGRVLLFVMRKRQIPKENARSLERLKAQLEGLAQVA